MEGAVTLCCVWPITSWARASIYPRVSDHRRIEGNAPPAPRVVRLTHAFSQRCTVATSNTARSLRLTSTQRVQVGRTKVDPDSHFVVTFLPDTLLVSGRWSRRSASSPLIVVRRAVPSGDLQSFAALDGARGPLGLNYSATERLPRLPSAVVRIAETPSSHKSVAVIDPAGCPHGWTHKKWNRQSGIASTASPSLLRSDEWLEAVRCSTTGRPRFEHMCASRQWRS